MTHPAGTSAALPVAAARRGDAEAWDVLFRRYQLPLYTYVTDLVRDPDAGFDLVQEVFARAVRHLGALRDDARFGSWLFGIAHQQVLLHWRRRNRAPFSSEPVPEDATAPEPEPDTELARREDRERILAVLDALPETHRSVLWLHYLEEFPVAEIAAITGVPVGTVKSRLHHARNAVRQALADPEDKPSPARDPEATRGVPTGPSTPSLSP